MSRAPTILAREFERMGYDVDASLRAGHAVRSSSTGVVHSKRQRWGDYDSKWEAMRAQLLELKRTGGLITDWQHHPFRLSLPDGGWYTPDFLITPLEGRQELEEIKGHWRHDSGSRKRFTIAAALHPQYFFRVWTLRRGAWVNIETRNA